MTKVHRECAIHHKRGRVIVLIGHAGHPEVVGTVGQLPDGAVLLVETVDDVERLAPPDPQKLAYATQTTLSTSSTAPSGNCPTVPTTSGCPAWPMSTITRPRL